MTDDSKKRPRGVTILTFLVVGGWIAAYVAEIFSPTFEAPASLDPLMLLVVGYYFTNTAVESRKKDGAS